MRILQTSLLTQKVKELFIEANVDIGPSLVDRLRSAMEAEASPIGKMYSLRSLRTMNMQNVRRLRSVKTQGFLLYSSISVKMFILMVATSMKPFMKVYVKRIKKGI